MTGRLVAAAIAVLAAAGISSAASAASINNTTYLYQGPAYNSRVLLTIPRGANVGIGGCQGNYWCTASYGGYTGWVHQSFVVGWGPQPGYGVTTGNGTTVILGGGNRNSGFNFLGLAGRLRGGNNNAVGNNLAANALAP